jgi:1-acyl-sn-glycerol-3-phosphate acyltransferase
MRRRNLAWWLYQPYKCLVVAPVLVISTTVFAVIAMTLTFLAKPRTVSRLSGVPWARIMAWVTPMRVCVEGRENLDPHRSYVLVSNHQSQYDIFVLYGWLGVDFKWVMKKELRNVLGIGPACHRLGHIFIDRSDHAAALATLNDAKRKIVDGTSVVFFPEGTRSRSGRLRPFKKGAFRMAIELGVPILPLTITGTRDVLPAGTTDLMPGPARLIIHAPVEVAECGPGDSVRLRDLVRDIIASSLPDGSGPGTDNGPITGRGSPGSG